MVRLISENFRSTMAGFRIAGLHPKRPGNRADAWEEAALKSFDDQHGERFELVRSKAPQFRALAALHAKKSCLECHEDAAEGDLLGGISLTLDAAPMSLAGEARKKDARQSFRAYRPCRHAGHRRRDMAAQPQKGKGRSRQPPQERLPCQHDP